MPGQAGVDVAHRRAGLHPHPGAAVEHLDRAEGRRVSARTPSVTPWPDRLVPPERKVSGTPLSWLARNSAATSAGVRGVATDAGTSR